MNWYLIILAILGGIMGIAPGVIADNVKICGDETCKLVEKHEAGCKIRRWLWIFGAVIWLSSVVLTFQVTASLDKKNKEMKSRIEVLEKQISQTDTTTVNLQNL